MTVSAENNGDEGVFDADGVTCSSSTITVKGAVLHKSSGGLASADELIAYFDFGSDQISSSGKFSITENSEGILNLS